MTADLSNFGAYRAPLQSSQRKPIVGCFPQTQPHQLMIEAIVDLRPECAHNVFTGRRHFAKIVDIEVEMSILPGPQRFFDGAFERRKIVERAALHIVFSANRCLGEIAVAMAKRVVAPAIKLRVFGFGKQDSPEAMGGAERHLHSKKNAFVVPYLGKKVVALVQAHAMQRQERVDAFVNVPGETFGRDGTAFQTGNLLVQMPVIEFRPQRVNAIVDLVETNKRAFAGSCFGPESEANTIIVPMN